MLGLEDRPDEPLFINGRACHGIWDANQRWYGDEPTRQWQYSGELVWWPERGMGWFPAQPTDQTYDQAYWDKYVGYAETRTGRLLNAARVGLASRHIEDGHTMVDIGIGCGSFLEARPGTMGYDVNPVAMRWLKGRGLWLDPYEQEVDAVSCWDALEHIPDPGRLVERVRTSVLLSIPIFDSAEHVLRSKHFRKDEHYWYFTEGGLIRWFDNYGFSLEERSRVEEDYGREDIGTYAFRRRLA